MRGVEVEHLQSLTGSHEYFLVTRHTDAMNVIAYQTAFISLVENGHVVRVVTVKSILCRYPYKTFFVLLDVIHKTA